MTEQREAVEALVRWSQHTAQLSETMQAVVAEFHVSSQRKNARIAYLERMVPFWFGLGVLVGWLL